MRNGLQTGCLVLGVLCFLYYIGIVVYAGITADFAWIWALGALFFLLLRQAMLRAWADPASPMVWVARIGLGLLAAGILVMVYMGGHILGGILEKPKKNLEYVVVLGAQVRGSSPSRALRKRLDRAEEYARENPDTILLLSGGKGSGEDITEAEAMYRYLLEKGVEEERIILEDRSTSTYENLLFCSELVPGLMERSVGILSNDFHVYRAGALAKKMGYQNISRIPAPCDWAMEPHYVLREICAVLKETLWGNMDINS